MKDDALLEMTVDYISAGNLKCGNPELLSNFLPNIINNLCVSDSDLDVCRKKLILQAVIKLHINKYNVVKLFQICSNTIPSDWKEEWFNYLSLALIER